MSNYNEHSISALEPLEAIRKRPSMYIGDVDSNGYHHLFYELFSNSVDEYLAGACSEIRIYLEDSKVTIVDNGRGIPWGNHPILNIPTLTVVMTRVHAGGKFDDSSYRKSGGMNGVGIKACTALSSLFQLTSKRDNKVKSKSIEYGKVEGPEVMDERNKSILSLLWDKTGTLSILNPDKENIFKTVDGFDYQIVKAFCKNTAFICPKLKIVLNYNNSVEEFYSENGIEDMLANYVESNGLIPLSKPLILNSNDLDIALVYTNGRSYNNSFVNCINTYEGGSHVLGLKKSIRDSFSVILRENDLDIDSTSFNCVFFLSYKMKDPVYRGQSKSKLSSNTAHNDVYNRFKPIFHEYILTNTPVLTFIKNYILETKKMEKNIEEIGKAADEINKKVIYEKRLPNKLIKANKGCTNDKRELYIVEGDSAMGTVQKARYPDFQEVLPLKGKIMNSIKSDEVQILKNEEVNNIVMSIGTGILNKFTLSLCRYDKIIICSDPDPDGAHISSLLFTLFVNYLPGIVDSGKLYIGITPLFCLSYKDKYVYGNTHKECFDKYRSQYGTIPPTTNVMRNKGLGEFNYTELRQIIMDPQTRELIRITKNESCIDLVNKIMTGDETKALLVNEVF